MRRQFDYVGRLFGKRSPILSSAVLVMDFGIIKHWIWRFCGRGYFVQNLQIVLEQSVDDRNNLPCNAPHDLSPACVLACSLIVAAFDGDQTFVDLTPLTLFKPDGLPYHQVHDLLHLALTAWSQ